MSRMTELAQQVNELKRYFDTKEIFSIDFEADANYVKVAMYKESFAKRFNTWDKTESGNNYRIFRFVDGVQFYAYVRKSEYAEFMEGVDF